MHTKLVEIYTFPVVCGFWPKKLFCTKISTGTFLVSPLSVLSAFSEIGDKGTEKAFVFAESP